MFDKSFSLIISKDGVSGLNFEHSWGDGVAVLRYIQDSFKDAKNNPLVSLNTSIASSDIAVECLGCSFSKKFGTMTKNIIF